MDSVAKVKSLDQVMNFSGLKLNVYELLCILFCIYFYIFLLPLSPPPLNSSPFSSRTAEAADAFSCCCFGYEMEKRI